VSHDELMRFKRAGLTASDIYEELIVRMMQTQLKSKKHVRDEKHAAKETKEKVRDQRNRSSLRF